MAVSDVLKQLRDETGISVMQCKKALEEAGGDIEKAKLLLRKASSMSAQKKADRSLGAGIVAAYTHAGGQVLGAVVLGCETDFVAKNEEFQKLAYDIAMHVAAMNPQFRAGEDIKENDLQIARSAFETEVSNIPEVARIRALEGKVDRYFSERVLLEQAYIKDPAIPVSALIDSAIQKFGEKIEVVRFERLTVK